MYIEEKMNSRYHNNCIYMQLDLLYEYCQWVIERFQFPAATHKTLYRGVNSLDDHWIVQDEDKLHKIVRFNSIVSFTDRRSIASEFGAYILEVEVPMVKLVFLMNCYRITPCTAKPNIWLLAVIIKSKYSVKEKNNDDDRTSAGQSDGRVFRLCLRRCAWGNGRIYDAETDSKTLWRASGYYWWWLAGPGSGSSD
jgi:hypothetical protein